MAKKRVTKASVKQHSNNEERVELTESMISSEEREQMISEAAYYRALQRGFDPEQQEDDWFEAEKIVDAMLKEAVKESVF